jgi:hypothetical protein
MKNHLNKNKIEQQVEDTLHSIDSVQRATPAPYLLTRIKSRMQQSAAEQNSIWFRLGILLSRPSIAFAALLVLLVINIVVINMAGSYNHMISKSAATQQKDEYAVNVISIYESEPNEP